MRYGVTVATHFLERHRVTPPPAFGLRVPRSVGERELSAIMSWKNVRVVRLYSLRFTYIIIKTRAVRFPFLVLSLVVVVVVVVASVVVNECAVVGRVWLCGAASATRTTRN